MFFDGAFRTKKHPFGVFDGGDDWPRLIGRGAVGFLIFVFFYTPEILTAGYPKRHLDIDIFGIYVSKKSQTGPTERTPKPEYLGDRW